MSLGAINFVDKSTWNALNTAINNCNAATLGEVNQMFAALDSPTPMVYGSQEDLGKRICIQDGGAVNFTYTTNGTLYGAVYQLVQVSASATAAQVAVGLAAFNLYTSAAANTGYVVTDEGHTAALTHLAGVFLNSITPGNYGFIAVHGRVNVKYTATVTATTAGSAVILKGDGSGKWDAPTQSGNPTFLQLAQIIGTAITAPANGALTDVRMDYFRGRY